MANAIERASGWFLAGFRSSVTLASSDTSSACRVHPVFFQHLAQLRANGRDGHTAICGDLVQRVAGGKPARHLNPIGLDGNPIKKSQLIVSAANRRAPAAVMPLIRHPAKPCLAYPHKAWRRFRVNG